MMQKIGNRVVYVVDFAIMPELPITGLTEEEQAKRGYKKLIGNLFGNISGTLMDLCRNPASDQTTYAEALTHAIETGVITEPGKYGIYIVPNSAIYEIYKIVE